MPLQRLWKKTSMIHILTQHVSYWRKHQGITLSISPTDWWSNKRQLSAAPIANQRGLDAHVTSAMMYSTSCWMGGRVVLCCILQWFGSVDFTHIFQGYVTSIRIIQWLLRFQGTVLDWRFTDRADNDIGTIKQNATQCYANSSRNTVALIKVLAHIMLLLRMCFFLKISLCTYTFMK